MTSYHLKSGGKKIRPLLTLSSAKLCGYENGIRDVNLAACVELIHNATLLHDDVIDNNDPNALLTGFQIGISYAIKKFNFALKLNKNNSFGKIENIGDNQNITMQFQFGYIFNKRKR